VSLRWKDCIINSRTIKKRPSYDANCHVLSAVRRTACCVCQPKVVVRTRSWVAFRHISCMLVCSSCLGEDPLSLKEAVRAALEKNAPYRPPALAGNGGEQGSRSSRRLFYEGQLFVILDSQRQSGFRVFLVADAASVWRTNFLLGRSIAPGLFKQLSIAGHRRPDAVDAGQTKHAVRSAGLRETLRAEDHRLAQMEVIASVVRSYYDAVLSAEEVKAADQALRSVEADLQQAENVRSAGLSTDADVLSIRVHRAGVREQLIRRTGRFRCGSRRFERRIWVSRLTPRIA